MSIVRRDAVLFDLIDLAYYIALDNVEAAYRFLDQVEESFRDLERMPLDGKHSGVSGSHARGDKNVAREGLSDEPDLLSADERWRRSHSRVAQLKRYCRSLFRRRVTKDEVRQSPAEQVSVPLALT